jgi:hypothetical protein
VHTPTLIISIVLALSFFPAQAQDAVQETCTMQDRLCVVGMIAETAAQIDNKHWRDQVYRELAKTQAFEQKIDEAIATIDSIESPDTQAMAIRGIGMVVAENEVTKPERDTTFAALRARAEKIEHEASYAIALTYIAMAQAFAGDNQGAWQTAADMENDALRHKAYAETAEIQAEMGDFDAAMKSIGFIESEAFRNKAYSIIAKIFADTELYEESLKAAESISNPYKKAQALQYVLDKHTPREQERKGTRALKPSSKSGGGAQ